MSSRREFLIVEEWRKIVARLGSTRQPQRAITAVARRVILNSPYTYNGVFFNVVGKSLGAGVYELTRKDM